MTSRTQRKKLRLRADNASIAVCVRDEDRPSRHSWLTADGAYIALSVHEGREDATRRDVELPGSLADAAAIVIVVPPHGTTCVHSGAEAVAAKVRAAVERVLADEGA